jgi:hypothetical protein
VSGRLVGIFIVVLSLIAGAGFYYTQVYAYYDRLPAETELRLMSIATGVPEPLRLDGFEGIDGSSSPLRFRACFTVANSLAMLTETFEAYEGPTPLTGPRWFGCYDAREIGTALERGEAFAFLGEKNIHDGVDRVIAVFPDGRAFAWHQLNEKYSE